MFAPLTREHAAYAPGIGACVRINPRVVADVIQPAGEHAVIGDVVTIHVVGDDGRSDYSWKAKFCGYKSQAWCMVADCHEIRPYAVRYSLGRIR